MRAGEGYTDERGDSRGQGARTRKDTWKRVNILRKKAEMKKEAVP